MPARDPYVAFTRRFFARWSPLYDAFAAPIGFAYAAAVRLAGAAAGRRILDVCTGTGEIARRLARRGALVTAIDLTPSMLLRARRKSARLGVRPLLMDARRLAFPDGEFDVAVVSFALHDMPEGVRVAALREAARVSREGVVVLDYEPPRRQPWRGGVVALLASFETPYLQSFVRQGGTASALSAAGLSVLSMRRPLPGFFAVRWAVPTARDAMLRADRGPLRRARGRLP